MYTAIRYLPRDADLLQLHVGHLPDGNLSDTGSSSGYSSVKFFLDIRTGQRILGNMEEKKRSSVGDLLRALRTKNGLSVQEAAKLVGCTRQHIHSMERGDWRPSAGLCSQLADIYHINADMLQLLVGHIPDGIQSEVDRLLNYNRRLLIDAWIDVWAALGGK